MSDVVRLIVPSSRRRLVGLVDLAIYRAAGEEAAAR
jgi:hypothetical protein